MSAFLCFTSSVACQPNGANKIETELLQRFFLNGFGLYSLKRKQNEIFFYIQSLQLSASTEAVLRRQSPFHSTQSKTAYLLEHIYFPIVQKHSRLLTLLSSFRTKKEITRESCCCRSWRAIIRRSDLLQILIKLWRFI